MDIFRWNSKIPNKPKPRLRVKASNNAWSFSYQGLHIGAIWYDGERGGICKQTLHFNPQLK